MNTPRDWADERATADVTRWFHDNGFPCDGNDLPALERLYAAALRAAIATPGVYAMDGDVFMCRVGVSVAQAASFAGGIDEFVRLSMEQAGSNMANRIRAAAEAARDEK